MSGESGSSTEQPIVGLGMITAIIVSVVIFSLAFSAGMAEVTDDSFDLTTEEVEYACNGLFGCGGPQLSDGVLVAVFAIVLVVVSRFIDGRHPFMGPAETDGEDGVTLVKQEYIKGDIETVLELEEKLDEELK